MTAQEKQAVENKISELKKEMADVQRKLFSKKTVWESNKESRWLVFDSSTLVELKTESSAVYCGEESVTSPADSNTSVYILLIPFLFLG